jgi:hypothetical protein
MTPTLLEHTHTTPGSWMRYDLESAGAGTRLRATYFMPEPDLAIERGDTVGAFKSGKRRKASQACHNLGESGSHALVRFAASPKSAQKKGTDHG